MTDPTADHPVHSLAALAVWEARFERPGFSFGRWVLPTRDGDSVQQMPYYEYGEEGLAFIRDVGRFGWIVAYDWMAWSATGEGAALVSDPSRIATAGADDLARLLTMIVRSDRFSEGAIASAFESGLLAAIVRRAGVLAAETGSG